ncbi:MAG: hypothetical protein WD894_07715 [Pirellulales bacterium]
MVVVIGLSSLSAPAQENEDAKKDDAKPETKEAAPDMMKDGTPGQGEMMDGDDNMEEMAKSMTAMAQTCETMMQREMRTYPWVLVGGATVGTLATMSLALFIVLEIQWIRHWHRRLKTGQGSASR